MGYIHKLNGIETCESNTLKKKIHEFSLCHTSKNVILILKLVYFNGSLNDK